MTPSTASNEHRLGPEAQPASTLRLAANADLSKIVKIHESAFRQFFLSRMGPDFLFRYYELVLNYHRGILLIAETSGEITGFASGFVNPAEFYKLMRKSTHKLALPTARALVFHPSLLVGIARSIQNIREATAHTDTQSCDLSSIAVTPEAGHTGKGAALAHGFLARAWSMNANRVRLFTDANGNDAANAFYRKLGFQQRRQFMQRKGRWMNEYVIAPSECRR